MLAPEAGPFQGANRPVDSLSAPSSPTLRPQLSNIGRSGSSPGPSTSASASKTAAKRHSTDGTLTAADGVPKPKGHGCRSIAGSIVFTTINPDLNNKRPDSLPAGSSTPNTSFASGSAYPTQAQCTNCGATSTPLRRRDPNDLLLCNACGLYLKLHKTPRPKSLKNRHSHSHSGHITPSATSGGASAPGSRAGSPSRDDEPGAEDMMSCFKCGTYATPLWRKDDAGHTVCNACGLYLKLHNEHRPVTMRSDVIKKRSRYDKKRGRASAANSRRTSPQPQSGPSWAGVEGATAAGAQQINDTSETQPNSTSAPGSASFPSRSWPCIGGGGGGGGGGETNIANQINDAFSTAVNRFSTGVSVQQQTTSTSPSSAAGSGSGPSADQTGSLTQASQQQYGWNVWSQQQQQSGPPSMSGSNGTPTSSLNNSATSPPIPNPASVPASVAAAAGIHNPFANANLNASAAFPPTSLTSNTSNSSGNAEAEHSFIDIARGVGTPSNLDTGTLLVVGNGDAPLAPTSFDALRGSSHFIQMA
ncbi:hypothetical protein NDA13_002125 [Ustilago tritici]|nr:hypothetical protein NDA13_002125 [Ustilago tritici]